MGQYYFDDIVPFVLYQLDYYGISCSRATAGEIIGCSASTVKKYDNGHWDPKTGRYVYSFTNPDIAKKLKGLPFPDKEIKTIGNEERDYIWIAGETGPYKKKRVVAPLAPLSDISVYNLKLKYGSNADIPQKSGIYMLAQVVCLPQRLNERYFLIKVGLSTTNLYNRVNDYKGSNPLAVCIDTQIISSKDVKDAEKDWHTLLEKHYTRLNGTEWFSVPYEDYLRFVEHGFDIVL